MFVPHAHIQREAIRRPEVVLKEGRAVEHFVVLVFAGALVERVHAPENEIGERVTGALRCVRPEYAVTRAPELVDDLYVLEGHLTAELNLVPALRPVHAIVDLYAAARERCEEVVANPEEPVRLDL